jgi:hypothetical protein
MSHGTGVAISSACGLHTTADGGQTFQPSGYRFSPNSVSEKALYKDGNNIYVGTQEGLFVSRDGGATFRQTFSMDIWNSYRATGPFLCQWIMQLYALTIDTIYASGSTVIIGANVGLLVSTDAGETFKFPKVLNNGYVIDPIYRVTGIKKVGTKIYVGMEDAAGASLRTKRPDEAGQCAVVSTLPDFGLLVSSDNGTNFEAVTLPTPMNSVTALDASGNQIVALGGTGANKYSNSATVSVSLDAGATFQQSPLTTRVLNGESSIAIIPGTDKVLLSTYMGYSGGTSWLYVSQDKGLSFGDLKPAVNLPPGAHTFTVLHKGTKTYLTSSAGVHISDNNGANFTTLKKHSSDACYYPWWKLGGAATFADGTGEGLKLYLSPYSTGSYNHFAVRSDDGANTFVRSSAAPLASSQPRNLVYDQDTLVLFSEGEGLKTSDDNGATWSAASLSYTFKGKPAKIFVYRRQYPNMPSRFYYSKDGQNLIAPFPDSNADKILDAYSNGSRLVTHESNGRWNSMDRCFYENGSKSGCITLVTGDANRLKVMPSGLFSLVRKLSYSTDDGKTFTEAVGTPSTSNSLFMIGTYYYLTSMQSDYLYISTDGGRTFTPQTAELR